MRRSLVDAAIDTLRTDGFAGASARAIAARAGCNQALVFYHFGSVTNLLLAALDAVSEVRRERYGQAVEAASGLADLVDVAASVFDEDLDGGHVAVLTQMIAGAASAPGLGPEVADRLRPWSEFARVSLDRALAGSPLGSVVPTDELAHAVVALYLGLELLSELDGDRRPAAALFDRARALAGVLATVMGTAPIDGTPTAPSDRPEGTTP